MHRHVRDPLKRLNEHTLALAHRSWFLNVHPAVQGPVALDLHPSVAQLQELVPAELQSVRIAAWSRDLRGTATCPASVRGTAAKHNVASIIHVDLNQQLACRALSPIDSREWISRQDAPRCLVEDGSVLILLHACTALCAIQQVQDRRARSDTRHDVIVQVT